MATIEFLLLVITWPVVVVVVVVAIRRCEEEEKGKGIEHLTWSLYSLLSIHLSIRHHTKWSSSTVPPIPSDPLSS